MTIHYLTITVSEYPIQNFRQKRFMRIQVGIFFLKYKSLITFHVVILRIVLKKHLE